MCNLNEYRALFIMDLFGHLSVIRDLIRMVDARLKRLHSPSFPGNISKTCDNGTRLSFSQRPVKIDIGFPRETIAVAPAFIYSGFDDPVPKMQAVMIIWFQELSHVRL